MPPSTPVDHNYDSSALLASEERFRALVESMEEVVFTLDINQRHTGFYGRWLRTNLLKAKDFLGKTAREIMEPERAAIHEAANARAVVGKYVIYEWEAPGPDGLQYYQTSLSPMYDAAGHVIGLVGIGRDITAQRHIQEELRTSEERYRLALASSNDGFWDWDLTTNEVQYSERCAEMLGYAIDELKPDIRTWEALLHPEDAPTIMRAHTEHLEGHTERCELEYRLLAKDGNWRWILDRSQVTDRAPDGTPLRMVGTYTNITQRKAFEAALRDSEEFFRTLIEEAPIGIVTIRNGKVTHANHACLKLFGLADPQQAIGSALLDWVAPERRAQVAEIYTRRLNGEAVPIRYETIARRLDGETFNCSVTSIAMKLPDGMGLVAFLSDLTEQQQAEENRLMLERRTQETRKLESLEVLAGGIAHDFNNLLTSILGFTELALDELPAGTNVDSLLQEVQSAVRRATMLTTQMLAASGRGHFMVQPLDLQALVNDLASSLRGQLPRTVILHTDVAAELPRINADAGQLRQVLVNLVTNASEAISERNGTITVAIRLLHVDTKLLSITYPSTDLPPGTYVAIAVSDTGEGMGETTRRRMFEPFFSTRFTGRGLGLAAVLGIVRGHGGTVHVRTKPGQGTTVTVLLPYADQMHPQYPRPEHAATPQLAELPSMPSATPKIPTILVIDDEEPVRKIAAQLLRRLGYQVITATDGQSGVELFMAHRSEIGGILLDMTMPVMGGHQTFHAIRQIDPAARVVLMSGYSAEEVLTQFAGEELAGFLPKPFNSNELNMAIAAIVPRPQG